MPSISGVFGDQLMLAGRQCQNRGRMSIGIERDTRQGLSLIRNNHSAVSGESILAGYLQRQSSLRTPIEVVGLRRDRRFRGNRA